MIDADEQFPWAVDAEQKRPASEVAWSEGIGGVLGSFHDVEGVLRGDLLHGLVAGQIPAQPMPDHWVGSSERLGNEMPVEPAKRPGGEARIEFGRDAVDGNVELRRFGCVGGGGQDVYIMSRASQGAGEARHVGSDTSEAFL